MYRTVIALLFVGVVNAHEMTPTYPTWEDTHITGVVKTKMEMFNKRKDVDYYEIGVFDKDMNPIAFVSKYDIVKLTYLQHLKFDVYINNNDKSRARYICSKSKLKTDVKVRTAIASRICSKFK